MALIADLLVGGIEPRHLARQSARLPLVVPLLRRPQLRDQRGALAGDPEGRLGVLAG
jgi:hypothetical protein